MRLCTQMCMQWLLNTLQQGHELPCVAASSEQPLYRNTPFLRAKERQIPVPSRFVMGAQTFLPSMTGVHTKQDSFLRAATAQCCTVNARLAGEACTATSLCEGTGYLCNLVVRTLQLGINHCIPSAVVLLSKDNLMQGQLSW